MIFCTQNTYLLCNPRSIRVPTAFQPRSTQGGFSGEGVDSGVQVAHVLGGNEAYQSGKFDTPPPCPALGTKSVAFVLPEGDRRADPEGGGGRGWSAVGTWMARDGTRMERRMDQKETKRLP